MAAEKNRHERDPEESGFFDDLNERVFKDYEPPKPATPPKRTRKTLAEMKASKPPNLKSPRHYSAHPLIASYSALARIESEIP